MKRLFVVFCLGLAVMAAMEALANDQVKKIGEKKTWQCEITKTSPDSITIDRNGIVDELLDEVHNAPPRRTDRPAFRCFPAGDEVGAQESGNRQL